MYQISISSHGTATPYSGSRDISDHILERALKIIRHGARKLPERIESRLEAIRVRFEATNYPENESSVVFHFRVVIRGLTRKRDEQKDEDVVAEFKIEGVLKPGTRINEAALRFCNEVEAGVHYRLRKLCNDAADWERKLSRERFPGL